MSLINKLKAVDRTTEVEHPEIEGFFIELRYISREELTKVRSKSLSYKFNKLSHQREEVVDNDKYIKIYSDKVIIGWRGLKIKDLPKLLPSDIVSEDGEKEIPYDKDEALDLLKNSISFDQFITDVMSDISVFEEKSKDIEEKN